MDGILLERAAVRGGRKVEVRMAARTSREYGVVVTQVAKSDAEGTLEASAGFCTCAVPVGPVELYERLWLIL